jgi:DNA repair exonuclease SbcCD nuclease subunit
VSDFTFLHAADLHLDSPLRGLDRDAPTARIRRATRDALVNLVDFALDRRVAFVLLAGDLYDGDAKDWRTGQFLTQQLARLTREKIEIVAISGNHDADQILTRRLPIPGMLPSRHATTHRLQGAPVAVHGQSFATRAVTDNLALAYPVRAEGLFNIGLLHTACGQGGHENYAPCDLADLERLEYEYWALGHVHMRQILCEKPWVVFPGNLQGRHVKEEGPKGASLVTVRGLRVAATPEPVAFDVIRWQRLDVDLTGAPTLQAAQDRTRFALDEAALLADGRMLIVRITLVGECAVHADLARSPEKTREEMRAAALDVAAPDQLWIEDVRIATRPALDLAAMRAQPGPVGALIHALEQPVKLDPGLQAFVADQLKRAGIALDPEHPATAIEAGRLPDDLVARARALLLAELASG